MQGTGVPIVTPFDESGHVDHDRLVELVDWLDAAGVDFLVPCGSTGEAPLLSAAERASVIETVAGGTDAPVLAGTGHEGFEPTLAATEDAADAGADAALVLTPSYYGSDDAAIASYYRDLAEVSPLPIYCYSVPKFTGHALSPRTVESLATHEGIVGIKDSSGDIGALQRLVAFTEDESFDVLVGSGSVYAAGLDAGADGGVLALANAVPERASDVYRLHDGGDADAARRLSASLVELNATMVGQYGVPGVKAVLESRDRSAGDPRRPLRPLGDDGRRELETILERTLDD